MADNNEQQFYEGQDEAAANNIGEAQHDGTDNQGNELGGAGASEAMGEDADLFDIKQRVKGMDEEAARLIQLQTEMEQQMKSSGSPTTSNTHNFLRITSK